MSRIFISHYYLENANNASTKPQVKPPSFVPSHEDDDRWNANQQTALGCNHPRPLSYQPSEYLLSSDDHHFRKTSTGAVSPTPSELQSSDSFSVCNRGLIGSMSQQPIQKGYPSHLNPYASHEQSQLQRLSSYYLAADARKRCSSVGAQGLQGVLPDEKHFQRSSYPPFQNDNFDSMSSHKQQSQYMAEAQSQMRAQLLFQQRRLQEQHLLQQQVQQLHRLHTQQLKQAKLKSLEAKQQASERSVAQHRTISDGPIYQVQCREIMTVRTDPMTRLLTSLIQTYRHHHFLQVQFKCGHRYMMLGESVTQAIEVGSFVIVEADRGEDLGVVVLIAPRDSPLAIALNSANSAVTKGAEGELKKILRVASLQERAELVDKAKDEMDILKVNTSQITLILTSTRHLLNYVSQLFRSVANGHLRNTTSRFISSMLSTSSTDTSWSFTTLRQGKRTILLKIFINITHFLIDIISYRRIDFREFVRDLYAVYKTRIWMQPTDANNTFRPNEIAARALATGLLSQSAIPSSLIPYEMESQDRLNSGTLPPSVMSSGNAGEYGEHSLRSCPPSIQISNSGVTTNHWAQKIAPQTKPIKQPSIQLSPSWQTELQHTDRSRPFVNTALYQQHQQLQYGSNPRLGAHN